MKLNLKVLFLVLVILCLVNFSLGWWGSRSSRSSSSRSHSGSRSSSSRGTRGSRSRSSSSANSGSKPRAHDIKTKQGLRDLYNKDVVKAERVERPFGSSGGSGGVGVKHSGVVVTTRDGDRQLVHKGKGYGNPRGGETVVTNAKHMSKDWKVTDEKPVSGAKVGDYVKAGGKDYNLVTDNCHHASKRMMKNVDGAKKEPN